MDFLIALQQWIPGTTYGQHDTHGPVASMWVIALGIAALGLPLLGLRRRHV